MGVASYDPWLSAYPVLVHRFAIVSASCVAHPPSTNCSGNGGTLRMRNARDTRMLRLVFLSYGGVDMRRSANIFALALVLALASACAVLGVGCSTASSASSLANGQYTVDVTTDSSMFHLNEADEGHGVLTVTDEGMSVHIRLVSKKITKLYPGTVEEAQADEAGIIDPTTDKVTYSDGYEEEVYGFDIPVPALDQEIPVAILGSKGNWYDHKVTVSNPVAEK